MIESSILSVITFLPLVGALAVLLVPGGSERNDGAMRAIALATTLAVFFATLVMWAMFDPNNTGFQFVVNLDWLQGGIGYRMGVDGISMLLVVLTGFLMPITIISSWKSVSNRVREYMIAFLILETLMMGAFATLDLALFYVFFEGSLIPMFLIIGIWGGKRRVQASYKFFFYTFTGSVLMLLAIMAIYWQAGTLDISKLLQFKFSEDAQFWLWLAFFASFAVKLPMWPIHRWLPEAHVEAPTAGSVILAAILLKLGGYGFLRFSLPMFPDASALFTNFVFVLSVVAIVATLADCAGSGRRQEAHRLFVRGPYGFRHHRHFLGHAGRCRWRGVPDAEPRADIGRTLFECRRHLRPHAYPRDRRLWRAGRAHAALRHRFRHPVAGQYRSAGYLRVHR